MISVPSSKPSPRVIVLSPGAEEPSQGCGGGHHSCKNMSVLFRHWHTVPPVRTGCGKPVISLFRNRALGSIFCSMTGVEKVEVQGGSIVGPPSYKECE